MSTGQRLIQLAVYCKLFQPIDAPASWRPWHGCRQDNVALLPAELFKSTRVAVPSRTRALSILCSSKGIVPATCIMLSCAVHRHAGNADGREVH